MTLPVLILFSGIGVFAALKATKPVQPKTQIKERIWRVEVEPVHPRTLAPILTLYGRTETPSMYKAAAPAPARVARVMVREGERVKQGDLLLELDQRDFQPRLDQAGADAAELEAQLSSERIRYQADIASLKHERKLLALAHEEVQRQQRMLKQNLGSNAAADNAEQAYAMQELSVTNRQREIDDHPARRKALEARLQRARAGLAQIELDVERSRITAPYDAIVAAVRVAEGDQLGKNAVLLSLYAPDGIELRARIPAPYQSEMQQALLRGESLQGRARLGSSDVRLSLVRLAGEADSSGVDALFRIDQGSEWLRTGQVLRFDLGRPAREDAVAVPYAAVYGGGRVYLLEDGRMRSLSVNTLGAYRGGDGEDRLLVHADGLKDGARLVVTHLPNAIDGLLAQAVGSE